MTNQLQKHIADSLERFDKNIDGYISSRQAKKLAEQSLLQLLEIARGEVEKKKNTVILGTEESSKAYKHKTDGYHRAIKDVLDTLTITKE